MTDTPVTVAPEFNYKNNQLHAESVPLTELAKTFDTPLFVYSKAALASAWQSYETAINGRNVLVCYGMKANSNLAILNQFHKFGAGFDIVSGGELARVIAAGGNPKKVVFSGVGKLDWEIKDALNAEIKCFNVESTAELLNIAQIAKDMNKVAPVSLRVNPDVDAGTHPYISTGLKENKFGIDINQALEVYKVATQHSSLKIVGLDCHIGSQITELSPYLDALDKLIDLIKLLKQNNIEIEHLDLGGGIGIRYTDETPLTPTDLLDNVFKTLEQNQLDHLQIVLEPGRSLVGNAGILLTKVQYIKENDVKNFAVVDAAMNDLIRPTLYDAWHDVMPVQLQNNNAKALTYDIVGPICESGDWLAKDRKLKLSENDYLAIMSAGAYAFTMASQYNTRARAAEVIVDGDVFHLVRSREQIQELFKQEKIIDAN